jgi:hypothetical protein
MRRDYAEFLQNNLPPLSQTITGLWNTNFMNALHLSQNECMYIYMCLCVMYAILH